MIGVAGYDGAAEFSVVATSTQYIVLDSGVPQAGAGSPIALTYFLFNVPPTSATGLEGGCAPARGFVPASREVLGGDELRGGLPYCSFATETLCTLPASQSASRLC